MSEDIPDPESVEITLADIKAKLKTLVIPSVGHKQLEELFRMGDLNHSQTVEKEELKQLFIAKFNICPSNKSLNEIFDAVDADRDGHINLNEWLTALYPDDSTFESRLIDNVRMAVKEAGLTREKLQELFYMTDADHNQLVDTAELKAAFIDQFGLRLSEDHLKVLFSLVDKDHDGHINLTEWMDAFYSA